MSVLRGKRAIIASVSVLVVLSGAGIVILYLGHIQAFIPPKTRSQLTFTPYTLTKATDFTADPQSVQYNTSSKLLTYIVAQGSTKITISQQAQPESFSDVPQVYDQLLQKLHSQQTFDTPAGKVSITYPQELGGLQTAVVNNQGTLLFAKPTANLSQDDWRKLFNALSTTP